MDLIKIYDLKKDIKTISDIQSATTNTDDYGLVPENGLFCSDEWWAAVDQGVIEKHTIDGFISRVYKTGHNDFDQFDIKANDTTTSWGMMGRKEYYVIGNKIKLVYVMQKNKKKFYKGDSCESKQILTIEVQNVEGIPPFPFPGFEMA
ncbi:MAG: hypothetical protein HQL19_00965 [Candidatus Omnitrophica bacterium]|nr:hypothetical protein [Candidatus Omnitrophota bacterium]